MLNWAESPGPSVCRPGQDWAEGQPVMPFVPWALSEWLGPSHGRLDLRRVCMRRGQDLQTVLPFCSVEVSGEENADPQRYGVVQPGRVCCLAIVLSGSPCPSYMLCSFFSFSCGFSKRCQLLGLQKVTHSLVHPFVLAQPSPALSCCRDKEPYALCSPSLWSAQPEIVVPGL